MLDIVEQNLAEPRGRAIEGGGEAGSGRFFEDFRNWTRIAGYEEVIRGSRLGEVAAPVEMGSQKAPSASRPPPRSRSRARRSARPGTRTSRSTTSTGPTPSRSGSRSTRGRARDAPTRRPVAREPHVVHAAQLLRRARARVLGRHVRGGPDVEADRDARTILGWALEPGDAVAFNMLTLHAAAGRATAGGRSRSGSSATTRASPCARMRRARRSPSWRGCSPTAMSWSIRSSRGSLEQGVMSRHAKINLLELKDPIDGRVDGIEGRFGRGPMGASDIGVSHWRYAPNFRSPMGHKHREQEEAYLVVSRVGRDPVRRRGQRAAALGPGAGLAGGRPCLRGRTGRDGHRRRRRTEAGGRRRRNGARDLAGLVRGRGFFAPVRKRGSGKTGSTNMFFA